MAGRDHRMMAQLFEKLGYRRDASRSERVRWMVWRFEPLLLVVLAAHYVLQGKPESAWAPVFLVAVACMGLGLFGVVQASTVRISWIRAAVACGLLIAIAFAAKNQLVDFVPWFAILGISYPLVFGLRRGWPFMIVNAIGCGVASARAFDGAASGWLRGPGILIGGVLAGFVADAPGAATAPAGRGARDPPK